MRGKTHEILEFMSISPEFEQDLSGKTNVRNTLGLEDVRKIYAGVKLKKHMKNKSHSGSKRGNKLETSEKCRFCQGLARMYAKNPCEQHLNVCERNIL